MALAKKCDICGRLYELYNVANSRKNWNTLKTYNIDHKGNYFSSDFIECCPKCQQIVQGTIEKIREGKNDE